MQDSLAYTIEKASDMLSDAFAQIQKETKLPACILEGCVKDLLLKVNQQKTFEILSDYEKLKNQDEKQEDDE